MARIKGERTAANAICLPGGSWRGDEPNDDRARDAGSTAEGSKACP